MPKNLGWTKIGDFPNQRAYELHEAKTLGHWTNIKSQKSNCTICQQIKPRNRAIPRRRVEQNSDEEIVQANPEEVETPQQFLKHKMRYCIDKCSNYDCNIAVECPHQHKILKCESTGAIRLFQKDIHAGKIFVRRQHGLSETVKELVEELIHNYDCKPKRIHFRLNRQEYIERVDHMPSLKLIMWYDKVDFHKYFVEQWIDSDFCNWQIYHTPPFVNI